MGIDEAGLVLGCMSFGSSRWRSWVLDEPASIALLDAAVEAGITAFDTANAYSDGESERILGRFLRARGLRDRAFVATKLYHPTSDAPERSGLGYVNVIQSAEGSLRRLGVDRIDLLQIHRWDDHVPIGETLVAFAALIAQGKVGAIGASNLTAWQLASAQLAAKRDGMPAFTTVQPHYNLLYREEERDLIPLCRDQGIALLPWSPLARGRLARAPDATSERAARDDVADTLYGSGGAEVIAALHGVAAELGEAPATVALAWLMEKDTAPIFGATSVRHIEQAARARHFVLSDPQIARLEAPYRALPRVELPMTARNQAPVSARINEQVR